MIDVSPIQIVIVLVIALLVFGPHRLPELGKQLGRGLREVKRQVSSVTDDISSAGAALHERDHAATAGEPSPEVEHDLLAGVVVDGAHPVASGELDEDDLLAGVVVDGATPPGGATPPPA